MGFKKVGMCKLIFLKSVVFYQKFVSPLLPKSCRYYPTCSEFAKEHLIKNKNVFFALYEIIKRLLRCNQIYDGGFDYPKIIKDIKYNNLKKNDKVLKIKYFYIKINKKKYFLIKSIN